MEDITNIRRELKERGQVFRITRGVSMEPLLRERETLADIRACDKEGTDGKECKNVPKIGDAVLFERVGGQLVLHRILKEKDGNYYICGDNCAYGEWVKESQILGVAVRYKRNGVWYPLSGDEMKGYVKRLVFKRWYLRGRMALGRLKKKKGL